MRHLWILVIAAALCACKPHGASTQSGSGSGPGPAAAPVSLGPGSTIDQAAPASVGTTISGAIPATNAHSNFYRFQYTGQLRDIVIVRLANKSTTLRPSLKLYNADRSTTNNPYDGTPGADVQQALSMDPGQVIYVEVEPYGSSGAYELSAIAQKAYDANEPNDDVLHPSPLKFGTSIEGSIMDSADQDWFHVSAPVSGKVEVHLESLSPTLRPDVKVFSSSKSAITEKYDGTPAADLDFEVDVEPGRDFYIEVVPYGSVGKYRLTTRGAVQAADMAASLKATGVVDLYGVYFDTDQTTIKPASATTLAEVGNLLKADPALRLEVSGHTDNSGTKSHNMELSQGRAESVVAWIAGQYGVAVSRLVAKGYGDTKPVAPNDNPDDMAKNRRVELRRI